MGWCYMVSVKEKVHAEMENISKILIELDKVRDKPNKELVILVGIGAFSKISIWEWKTF